MTPRLTAALAAVILAGAATTAHASVYDNVYSVFAAESAGYGQFDTTGGNPFKCGSSNTACATFTYTGLIDFNNQAAQNGVTKQGDQNSDFGFTMASITNYKGSGTVVSGTTTVANYNSRGGFLNSSGSASNFAYGTYFEFDLGVVAAGTVLTITHDDGVSLYQGMQRIGMTVSGPTGQTTDTVRIDTTGDTILRYARENGTPSVLIQDVPEPVSMALVGVGLLGVGGMRSLRRRDPRAA